MKPLYQIDEDFFSSINTEHKSYFLGLIYSDGYLHESRGYMSLTLQERDVDILIKLKKSINTNKPLLYIHRKEKSTQNQYRLLISRKKMINDLILLGIRQNKSLTCTPNKILHLDKELIRHFIRGYYDGDGSITFYKTRNTFNSTINICCTKEFYIFFSNYIFENIGIKSTLSKRFKDNKNIFDLRICGNRNVKKFLEYLYKDSTIKLDRKYEKFMSFLLEFNKLNKKLGNSVILHVLTNENNLIIFNSYVEASKFFNVPLTTMKRKIKKDKNYLGHEWKIHEVF